MYDITGSNAVVLNGSYVTEALTFILKYKTTGVR